jgi:methylenetetrahydrofolate dehydrogenase (NADP+)/methenyltetrahydrofolate cyclohydrolase
MIIDGRKRASEILTSLQSEVAGLSFRPKLVDVVVGNNPVTESYVGIKQRRSVEIGLEFVTERLPESISQKELIEKIISLQRDPHLAGLLVQLPLPKNIDSDAVMNAIDPALDVDGLTEINTQALYSGTPNYVPATAAAVIELIEAAGIYDQLNGMKTVVIGNGSLVGKPVTFLLKSKGADLTVVNRSSGDISEVCKAAKLIVSGAGSPNLLTGDMVSDGVVVIDAGTAESNGGISGDVDFASVSPKASFITPVPGGVGPVTVAMLLRNTVISAKGIAAKISAETEDYIQHSSATPH